MATSLPQDQTPVPTTTRPINPMDDLYMDSRILRRQMRRLRKLQERERDRLRNQQIALIYRISKERKKEELRRQIEEEKQCFDETDNQFLFEN
jgi:hypothetical protein